jgi:hypothetical protein
MKDSNQVVSVCEISADECYKPVCIYEDETGGKLYAFFQWEDPYTLAKAVFSELPGDKQVGKAYFDKEGIFRIVLKKSARVFKRFTIDEMLEKGRKYPIIIDFNEKNGDEKDDEEEMEDPTKPGSVIVRQHP